MCLKVLVFWAQADSDNLGVRALADGMGAVIKQIAPDVELSFVSHNTEHAPTPLRPKDLLRAALLRSSPWISWLQSFDLVIDLGEGDSFSDIYGWRRYLALLASKRLIRNAKVPFIVGPQTIGPFRNAVSRSAGWWALSQADTIYVRDSASGATVPERFKKRVQLASDLAFALPEVLPTPGQTWDLALNVSGLLWQPNDHVSWELYQHQVRELLSWAIAEKLRVLLVPHVLGDNHADSDVSVTQTLLHEFGAYVDASPATDLYGVRSVLSKSCVVVGARMHACLNSISVGRPAYAWAYSRKFRGVLGDLAWTRLSDLREDRAVARSTIEYVARVIEDDRAEVNAARSARAQAIARLEPFADQVALQLGRAR